VQRTWPDLRARRYGEADDDAAVVDLMHLAAAPGVLRENVVADADSVTDVEPAMAVAVRWSRFPSIDRLGVPGHEFSITASGGKASSTQRRFVGPTSAPLLWRDDNLAMFFTRMPVERPARS
jgi:hypothetical protein